MSSKPVSKEERKKADEALHKESLEALRRAAEPPEESVFSSRRILRAAAVFGVIGLSTYLYTSSRKEQKKDDSPK